MGACYLRDRSRTSKIEPKSDGIMSETTVHSEEEPENNEYNSEYNEIGTISLIYIGLDEIPVGSIEIDSLTVILCRFVSTKVETTMRSEEGPENNEYNPE